MFVFANLLGFVKVKVKRVLKRHDLESLHFRLPSISLKTPKHVRITPLQAPLNKPQNSQTRSHHSTSSSPQQASKLPNTFASLHFKLHLHLIKHHICPLSHERLSADVHPGHKQLTPTDIGTLASSHSRFTHVSISAIVSDFLSGL